MYFAMLGRVGVKVDDCLWSKSQKVSLDARK